LIVLKSKIAFFFNFQGVFTRTTFQNVLKNAVHMINDFNPEEVF